MVKLVGDSSSLERHFKKANVSAKGFNKSMTGAGRSSRRGQGAMRGLGSSVRLAGGAFLGGAGVIAGITSTLKKTAEFEKSLNTFQAVAGASATQMKAVSATALKLGGDITLPKTSAKDAALAMAELAKGGLSVKQAMAAAKGTLQLAAAGQIEVAEAATVSARALNAFGLSGDQAGRVADVLANAANSSTGEITDFAQALQQSSATAKQYGLSIEETTAAIAELANKGIVGSDAGTSLKTMLTRLVPSTEKARKEMARIGVTFEDAQGNLIPFRDQIVQYQRALKRLTPAQRAATINTIFGSDAQRAANIILGGGVKKFDEMHAAISKQGSAARISAALNKGLLGAFDGLKSAIETVQIQLGTKLAPLITKYLKIAATWLGNTKNQKAIMDTLKSVMASVAAVANVLRTAFGALARITGSSKNAIIALLGVFALFKAAKMASTVAGVARNFGLLGRNAGIAGGKMGGARGGALALRGSLVGKAGLVGGVLLAGFALSKLIRKIPGWETALRKLGGAAHSVAEALGLVNDPGKQFEGKTVLGQKASKFLRQKAARLQASGLTARESAQRIVKQHPKVALRDAQVLAGVFGNKPQVQNNTYNITQQPGESGPALARRITEEQRKAAKRNTIQRRGAVSGR